MTASVGCNCTARMRMCHARIDRGRPQNLGSGRICFRLCSGIIVVLRTTREHDAPSAPRSTHNSTPVAACRPKDVVRDSLPKEARVCNFSRRTKRATIAKLQLLATSPVVTGASPSRVHPWTDLRHQHIQPNPGPHQVPLVAAVSMGNESSARWQTRRICRCSANGRSRKPGTNCGCASRTAS